MNGNANKKKNIKYHHLGHFEAIILDNLSQDSSFKLILIETLPKHIRDIFKINHDSGAFPCHEVAGEWLKQRQAKPGALLAQWEHK